MPVPEGYHSVTPFVIVKGADRFLDFMADAFDAHELARVFVEDGRIGHAESRIGDSVVMAFYAKEDSPETPAFLRLYVDDCDASYQQALKAGGIIGHEADGHALGRPRGARPRSAGQPVVAHDPVRRREPRGDGSPLRRTEVHRRDVVRPERRVLSRPKAPGRLRRLPSGLFRSSRVPVGASGRGV